MIDPEFKGAPGCFGSAMTFKIDAPECATCIYAAACGPRSAERLTQLRAKYGVNPPESPARKKKTVADAGFTVPIKVAALLERIAKIGVNVGESLNRGVNPFASVGPASMTVVCHLMLKYKEGVVRESIVPLMEHKLKCSRPAAAGYTLHAIQALVALGVADEIDGLLIRRNRNDA